MTQLKVAVVQASSIPYDPKGSTKKACELLSEAAARGAKLAVFPEGFISTYPKGLEFGARFGMRLPEGREEFESYWRSAIDVPGPETDQLSKAACDNQMYFVIGVIERDGGTLYCTVLFFAPDGSFLGKHRKLMPTAMERLTWGFGDGSTLSVFNTPIGNIGSVICWENYMPMLRMAMYAKNIQLYCAVTADDRESWIPSMRHIAYEGRCFVLSACQFIKRSDYPEMYKPVHGKDPKTVLIRGGSCIVSPFGEILAGPEYEKECILTAEIDLGDIARGKYDLDVVGHYARPDIFRLHVNETPMPAVVINSNKIDEPFNASLEKEDNDAP